MNCVDCGLGIGDWGLGIGDGAQSPIPNLQSPFLLHTLSIFLPLKNKAILVNYNI